MISIIIPALNEAACLPTTLAAIRAAAAPFAAKPGESACAHEILVVDGGSTDATACLARTAGPSSSPAPVANGRAR